MILGKVVLGIYCTGREKTATFLNHTGAQVTTSAYAV